VAQPRERRRKSRCQIVSTSSGTVRVQGDGKTLSPKALAAIDALVLAVKQLENGGTIDRRKNDPA
jgi:hypothetical protein